MGKFRLPVCRDMCVFVRVYLSVHLCMTWWMAWRRCCRHRFFLSLFPFFPYPGRSLDMNLSECLSCVLSSFIRLFLYLCVSLFRSLSSYTSCLFILCRLFISNEWISFYSSPVHVNARNGFMVFSITEIRARSYFSELFQWFSKFTYYTRPINVFTSDLFSSFVYFFFLFTSLNSLFVTFMVADFLFSEMLWGYFFFGKRRKRFDIVLSITKCVALLSIGLGRH